MTNKRSFPLFFAVVSAAALMAAYIAQYGFGLEPCHLCLIQRIPFAVVIALSVAALWRPAWAWRILYAIALAFFIGAAVAVYHVGVEQHWWQSAVGCAGGLPTHMTPQELLSSLHHKPVKPCDQVDWALFGISMAGWNIVFSSFLGLAATSAAGRLRPYKRPARPQ